MSSGARIAGTIMRTGSMKSSIPSGSGEKIGPRQVTPLFSFTRKQARYRVLALYRAWYREVPFFLMDYVVQKDAAQCRRRLKELFMANKHVTDIRAIDLLVAKGQMELRETIEVWKQKTHLLVYFRDTEPRKPEGFLAKFLSGKS